MQLRRTCALKALWFSILHKAQRSSHIHFRVNRYASWCEPLTRARRGCVLATITVRGIHISFAAHAIASHMRGGFVIAGTKLSGRRFEHRYARLRARGRFVPARHPATAGRKPNRKMAFYNSPDCMYDNGILDFGGYPIV
jgi:hypothetical protein